MANAHVEFTYDGQNVELLFKGLPDADARTLYRIFGEASRSGNNPHVFGFGWCGEWAAEGVAKAKEKKGKK